MGPGLVIEAEPDENSERVANEAEGTGQLSQFPNGGAGGEDFFKGFAHRGLLFLMH